MARINLLPWREDLREERKREFFVILGGVVIIAGGILFLYDRFVRGEVSYQQARNDYIRAEIVALDARVESINTLKDLKEDIKDRMSVIRDLEDNRPIIVHMFDELVKTLPDGVYFDSLTRTGNQLDIVGVAESNTNVSELMRRLGSSDWFANPQFDSSSSTDSGNPEQLSANTFHLTVDLETLNSDQE